MAALCWCARVRVIQCYAEGKSRGAGVRPKERSAAAYRSPQHPPCVTLLMHLFARCRRGPSDCKAAPPTSLYRRNRDPAERANLPVASFEDCLPPALALGPRERGEAKHSHVPVATAYRIRRAGAMKY